MTINKKLTFGFSIIVGILVSVGILSSYNMGKISDASNEVADWRMPTLQAATNINNAAYESNLGIIRFVFLRSAPGMALAEGKAHEIEAILEESSRISKQFNDTDLENENVTLSTEVKALLNIYNELKVVSNQLKISQEQMQSSGQAVLATTDDFMTYVEKESKQLYEKAVSQFEIAAFVQKYNKVNQIVRKTHTLFELEKQEQLLRDRTSYKKIQALLEETVYLFEDIEIVSMDAVEGKKITSAIEQLNAYQVAADNWVAQDDLMKERFKELSILTDSVQSDAKASQDRISAQVEAQGAENVTIIDQATLIVIAGVILGVVVGLLTAIIIPMSINKSLDALAQFAKSFGRGDLTARVELTAKDEIAKIGNIFNQSVDELGGIIRQLDTTSNSLTDTASTLKGNVIRTTEGTEAQQINTESVAAAMNEMAGSVGEVSENTRTAADAALKANSTATEGKVVFQSTIDSINSLASDVENAVGVIHRLENDANSISSVLEVISSISAQTNLLALNAAIEAARAGEQGRGFAVVAEEVRTLATRTQASTEEIQKMIERLQSGTKEAVKVMSSSHTMAIESVSKTSESDEALSAIVGAVSTINELNSQIAHGMSEQATAVKEINKSIEQISAVSESSLNDVHQTSTASKSLEGLANQLQGAVKLFKLS